MTADERFSFGAANYMNMDALTHAIEADVSTASSPIVDVHALADAQLGSVI